MGECYNVLQKQSRMAHLNSTKPPIHIMDAKIRIHHHKYAIQFYQHILLDNHSRTQQTGQNSDIHNTDLHNLIQKHTISLRHLQSLSSPPPILTPTLPPTTTATPTSLRCGASAAASTC